MKYMMHIVGLSTSASPHENNGLVMSIVQHLTIGYLGGGENVGWHVFLFTSFEHLNYLNNTALTCCSNYSKISNTYPRFIQTMLCKIQGPTSQMLDIEDLRCELIYY